MRMGCQSCMHSATASARVCLFLTANMRALTRFEKIRNRNAISEYSPAPVASPVQFMTHSLIIIACDAD